MSFRLALAHLGMLDAAPLLEMGWGFTQALCESLAKTLVADT